MNRVQLFNEFSQFRVYTLVVQIFCQFVFSQLLSHVGFKHLELILWVLSNVLLTVSLVQACSVILKIRGLLSDASPKDFAAEVEKGLCWFHSSCESSLGAVCIHTCYIYSVFKSIHIFIYIFFLIHVCKHVCTWFSSGLPST